MNSVRVTRKGEDRIRTGHPWVYTSDVTDRSAAAPGEAVRVLDTRGRPLGVAHHSSTSQIALRLLSRTVEPIDKRFFERRLTQAIAHRERVVRDSNACRLVFSEADLLPGLIVDRYGAYLVIQTVSQGMDQCRDLIAHCLDELLKPAGILARNDASVRSLEGLERETVVLTGEVPERVIVQMNGLTLEADLFHGQKTGAYLDQRENYVAAAANARGRVLDCFTSTGGFALHVARRAESVEAIDSSAPALATAAANARENGIENVHFRQADVFDFLSGIERRYSMVILDPPAFAKSRKQLDDAARGYKEINLRALRLLDAGGILVTCSCSHHVSEAMLLQIVAEAALDAGKIVRVLERRTQASDHPILLTVPETLYLKCLILEVLGA
ncbi:MAG: class I SAM-dependent rRNA methyltransferase [Bryobacterales bacterium]|nr:class I SAM-dependent rRNA methyltransferase [Bryobacterales bacterium]MBV9397818.1 class I SAM-dependent rRNA methyltransferase [Bryobacterales bacterium]